MSNVWALNWAERFQNLLAQSVKAQYLPLVLSSIRLCSVWTCLGHNVLRWPLVLPVRLSVEFKVQVYKLSWYQEDVRAKRWDEGDQTSLFCQKARLHLLGPGNCKLVLIKHILLNIHRIQFINVAANITSFYFKQIETLFAKADNSYLLGDLNCDLLSEKPHTYTKKLLELIRSYSFDQVIKEPTCITQWAGLYLINVSPLRLKILFTQEWYVAVSVIMTS